MKRFHFLAAHNLVKNSQAVIESLESGQPYVVTRKHRPIAILYPISEEKFEKWLARQAKPLETFKA